MQVTAQAQTSRLHGQVLDAATKNPLPFVTVTNMANRKASQKADAVGSFAITVVTAIRPERGLLRIKCEKMNYV
jgi:hypothetical protein